MSYLLRCVGFGGMASQLRVPTLCPNLASQLGVPTFVPTHIRRFVSVCDFVWFRCLPSVRVYIDHVVWNRDEMNMGIDFCCEYLWFFMIFWEFIVIDCDFLWFSVIFNAYEYIYIYIYIYIWVWFVVIFCDLLWFVVIDCDCCEWLWFFEKAMWWT
jgi:hypothetical protein